MGIYRQVKINILLKLYQMKNTFLALIIITLFAFLQSCNSGSCKMTGKWEKENSDSAKLVLELTASKTWNFYENDSLVETGKFEITDSLFTLKHGEEAHSHDDATEHKHDEDHVYQYELNSKASELKLIHGEKTSVYKKIK